MRLRRVLVVVLGLALLVLVLRQADVATDEDAPGPSVEQDGPALSERQRELVRAVEGPVVREKSS